MLNKNLSSPHRKVNCRGLCQAKPQIIISNQQRTDIILIPSFQHPIHSEPSGNVELHLITLFNIPKPPQNTIYSQYSLSPTLSITARTLWCVFRPNVNSLFHDSFCIRFCFIIPPSPLAFKWCVIDPLRWCELQKHNWYIKTEHTVNMDTDVMNTYLEELFALESRSRNQYSLRYMPKTSGDFLGG